MDCNTRLGRRLLMAMAAGSVVACSGGGAGGSAEDFATAQFALSDQVTYQIVNHTTPTAASVQLTISTPSSPSAFLQTHLTVKKGTAASGISGNITKSSNSAVITVGTNDFQALLTAMTNFPVPPGPMPLTVSGADNADGTILIVNSWTLP